VFDIERITQYRITTTIPNCWIVPISRCDRVTRLSAKQTHQHATEDR